jgi:putative tricarboxylic transport membrane protein
MVLLLLGMLGLAMRRYSLPVLPLMIGLIVGPRAEQQLRQALQLRNGDITGLWSEPTAIVVYIVVALVLAWPLLSRVLPR